MRPFAMSRNEMQWRPFSSQCVSQLWEQNSPQPVYLGEEYALPLIGADALDQH